jgi:hypothetical protein
MDWSRGLDPSKPMNLYTEFKNLSLAFNLEIFLGIHHKDDDVLGKDFRYRYRFSNNF